MLNLKQEKLMPYMLFKSKDLKQEDLDKIAQRLKYTQWTSRDNKPSTLFIMWCGNYLVYSNEYQKEQFVLILLRGILKQRAECNHLLILT